MDRVVTFGEVMARMKTKDFLRFRQSLPGDMEVTFAGAEANVAASIALLGGSASFVSALPRHQIADACIGELRNLGVDTSRIVRTEKGRLGIYFVEMGANQRPSNVIYDRDYSSISIAGSSSYDWERILNGAAWFHITGITPALSATAATVSLDAVSRAKALGLTVSCDLNFRKKLWNWEEGTDARTLAQRVMRSLLPHVDVLIANEEDAHDVLGVESGSMDTDSGTIDARRYSEVAEKIAAQFPNISKIAITLRESVSATHNNWGGMLYDVGSKIAHFMPLVGDEYRPYPIKAIVDRIGGGDSFSAALVFAFMDPTLRGLDSDVISFATAASCLCHSIQGDFNFTTREEVLSLMGGRTSGRINR